jgi:hypothetical protein
MHSHAKARPALLVRLQCGAEEGQTGCTTLKVTLTLFQNTGAYTRVKRAANTCRRCEIRPYIVGGEVVDTSRGYYEPQMKLK